MPPRICATIKALVAAAGILAAAAVAQPVATLTVHADRTGPILSRMVFGQFAEHLGRGVYGGIWVGEGSPIPNDHGYRLDVLDALRAIRVPMVRWPGGCFADGYNWRDGIGPGAARPRRTNASWGGDIEDNSFGTHEFMGFVERLGAQAYIAANVGSAPPRETAEWLEYMTAPAGSTLADERVANGRKAPWTVSFIGIGNELWGCGGNMRADYAADVTKRYATFARAGNGTMKKIASGANDDDYAWTDTMMRVAGNQIDGLSLHYYTVPGGWENKGAAIGFNTHDWAETLSRTLRMDDLITRHAAVMDKYDPDRKTWLVVDEWGTWYAPAPGKPTPALFQQNSLRDAIVAAINLNIFAHHADRVKMAASAQMVNVLQAMLLTDGPRMIRTPTYWVFDLYKPWQDAMVLPIELDAPQYADRGLTMPAISASAVRDTAGKLHLALVNLDPDHGINLAIALPGLKVRHLSGQIITSGAIDAHNSFDAPDVVKPAPFAGARARDGGVTVELPPKALVVLEVN